MSNENWRIDWQSPHSGIGLASLLFLIPTSYTAMRIFYSHRKSAVIYTRFTMLTLSAAFYELIICGTVGCFIVMTLPSGPQIDNIPRSQVECFVLHYLSYMKTSFFAYPLIIRIFRHYFLFHSNRAKKLQSEDSPLYRQPMRHLPFIWTPTPKWFLDNRYLASKQHVRVLYVANILIHITLALIVHMTYYHDGFFIPDLVVSNGRCNFYQDYFIFLPGSFLWGLLSIFCIILLKTTKDLFGMNRELQGILVTWTCSGFFYFFMLLNVDSHIDEQFPIIYIGFLMLIAVLYWILIFPLMILKQDEEPIVKSTFKNLQELMKDKKALSDFKDFLIQEFSFENLLFYEAVTKYRNNADFQLSRQHDFNNATLHAKKIYLKYLVDSSEYPVNIDSSIRQRIIRRLERNEITPIIFDEAQEHVYNLMNLHSFRRFNVERATHFKKS